MVSDARGECADGQTSSWCAGPRKRSDWSGCGPPARPGCSSWARICAAPEPVDPLEDWIRLPAAEDDLRVRVVDARGPGGRTRGGDRPSTTTACSGTAAGGSRSRRSSGRSPPRSSTASARWSVATRSCAARGPAGARRATRLDVHMLRLRRRIAALGLEVRTVRARGYLLQAGRTAPTPTLVATATRDRSPGEACESCGHAGRAASTPAGPFTDLVDRRRHVRKVPSTPHDPGAGGRRALRRARVRAARARDDGRDERARSNGGWRASRS